MARKEILTPLDGGNGDIKVGFTSEGELILPEAGVRTASGNPVLFPTHGVPVVLAASAVAASGAADTNENVLATVTIPAGAMGTNGMLRVRSYWTVTNSANTKTVRTRLGGIGGTNLINPAALTTTPTAIVDGAIINRNSAAVQIGVGFWPRNDTLLQTHATAWATGTVNTATAQDLVITAQKASAGETMTLEAYIVEILKQA